MLKNTGYKKNLLLNNWKIMELKENIPDFSLILALIDADNRVFTIFAFGYAIPTIFRPLLKRD